MKSGLFVSMAVFIVLAASVFGATSQFVFTTEPQTIFPGELSEEITIQSQDASGNKVNTTETIDLEFSSTSTTGEFLNSSGNPASAVMAKNTANRTFYYRDSTAGTYTLTVRLTGRESGQSWQASQQIAVGSSGFVEEGEEENQSASQSVSEPPSPQTSALKAEYGAQILGGDKVAIVGSQINFESVLSNSLGKPIETADFLWSFGDGARVRGRLSAHTYNYPGEYIVFLNIGVAGASYSDSITVNVIPNEVMISEVKPDKNGWIEIFNASEHKIDLSHWAVSNGREAFYFPKNTFIGPKAYLVITGEILGIEFLSSGSAFLLYPRGDVAYELAYSGILKNDESFHNVDGAVKIGVESPSSGRFVARVSLSSAKSGQNGQSLALTKYGNGITDVADVADTEHTENIENTQTASVGHSQFFGSTMFWFLGALVLGVLSAVGYLFIVRRGSL